MQKFKESLIKLEHQVNKIIQINNKLYKKLDDLNLELKEKEKYILFLFKKNKYLEKENKKIKIVSAIYGNPEYRKLMKFKINRLINEIQNCINQLSK